MPRASSRAGKETSGAAAATGGTKKTKKEKDPNAPKRPQSAYMAWLAESRESLKQPGMKPTEVLKAAGEAWGKVGDKSKWEAMAAKDRERYERELAAYKNAANS